MSSSTDSKFASLLTREVYTGTASQTASAALIAASGGEWTSAERAPAWPTSSQSTPLPATPSRAGWCGPPSPCGLKLYDPRTTTTVHSANPALALLWFIRSEFGYAHPTP